MQNQDIIIISGPSGAGKSSLCKEAFKYINNLYFSISSTTRKIRDGEIDGVHYNFISEDAFLEGIKNNDFLEWAEVHNNYYGTSKSQVIKALANNKIVLFDIDIQGQRAVKKQYPHSTSIFITTPNKNVLESRLKARDLDSIEVIESRLKHAYNEMQSIESFDYLIINDDFDSSLDAFLSIIKSLQFKNNKLKSKKIYQNWR
ncbi:guanylate kinase [Helicobacter sp. MIT 14-3879]|uniref:guanylate kinase n=1 Tax=Helicobacter sp. MIT 14-3879 TaxID=2040649 RepID=UPI000E1F7E2F|nr:guanylate kinase [Helicobacter sp. MIT 14-3879]RDU65093.1 guanylate kinase [Helicobacter sp. MIT 14-3879]